MAKIAGRAWNSGTVQVTVLGPLEVRGGDGELVDVAGPRLRALLARLALDAGRPVSVATLVDAVWGEQPPADEVNALQTLISRLRRALGGSTTTGRSAAGYRLDITRDDVDALRFEQLAARTLGAAAVLRGAEDPTSVDIVRVSADLTSARSARRPFAPRTTAAAPWTETPRWPTSTRPANPIVQLLAPRGRQKLHNRV
jgi:hypothetical protein